MCGFSTKVKSNKNINPASEIPSYTPYSRIIKFIIWHSYEGFFGQYFNAITHFLKNPCQICLKHVLKSVNPFLSIIQKCCEVIHGPLIDMLRPIPIYTILA